MAGHDTLATALTWTFHHLAEHAEVLERAYREVDGRLGDGDAPFERVELPWIDAIVKESLRLTPVLPIVSRRLKEDLCIAGVDLPRGARAAPNVYLAHREPALWPEPTRFCPARFLADPPSPGAYFPFGGGPRRCIGMAFSLLEMRVVIATTLRRLWIRRAPAPPVRAVGRGVVLTRRTASPSW